MSKRTKQLQDKAHRVSRGGGWVNSAPSWVRAASRDTHGPALRYGSLGFRCALRGREPRV